MTRAEVETPLNILVLDYKDRWHPESGGAQNYVQAIVTEWIAAGHEVTIFSSASDRPGSEFFEGIHYVRSGNKYTVFHEAKRFLVKQGDQYDVVLDSVNQRPFLAHEVVGERATSLVYHLGLEVWKSEFSAPLAFVGRHILEPEWMRRLNYAPRLLALSESTRESLLDYGLPCDDTVEPGMPAGEPILNRQLSEDPRVVFLGRLVENKRPLDAILAFHEILREFPNASIDVMGDGYLMEEAKKFASENVRIWGHVTEEFKTGIFDLADLMLVTSVREGWGMVVTEAGARGVPTVGYNIPGLRDSVVDGETGVLTEEDPAALGAAAIKLLGDPAEWQRLSQNTSLRATGWTWSDAATKLLKIMTSPPRREPWLRTHPEYSAHVPELAADVLNPGSVHQRQRRYDQLTLSFVVVVWMMGVALRVFEAVKMPWRDSEILYVQSTGQWFSHHLFAYIFQFQQHIYPPQSQFFTTPPLAMWIFGIAIAGGKLVGASALLSARLASVAISLTTNVLIFRTGRRWLSVGPAVFASCVFALLPLAIVTGSSALVEPLLTLEMVLALDGYLRLKDHVSYRNVAYLGGVLGASLLTKLSYGLVFSLICAVAVVHLSRVGRRAMAAMLVGISLGTPLLVWSGFRTPSQYSSIFRFLSTIGTAPGMVIDHWRFPLAFVSAYPIVMLAAWLLVVVSPLAFPHLMRGAPRDLIFVASLPAVAIVELMVFSPSGWNYQLLPAIPFIILPAGWLLRRYFLLPQRRTVVSLLLAAMTFEFVFMFSPLISNELSLSISPIGAAVRGLDPNIDVPYGTGSETIPALARYVNSHLPADARIAATYLNENLSKYVKPDVTVGAWLSNVSIGQLTSQGYQYAVFVDHYVPPSTRAGQSIKGLQPIFEIKMRQGTVGEIFRIPDSTTSGSRGSAST